MSQPVENPSIDTARRERQLVMAALAELVAAGLAQWLPGARLQLQSGECFQLLDTGMRRI